MSAYEHIQVGDYVEKTTVVTVAMVEAYASLTGDFNPVHMDEDYASRSFFKKRVAHGLIATSLTSALLGTKLPGPGSIYLSQNIDFKNPVFLGDAVTARVEVLKKEDYHRKVCLRTSAVNQNGSPIMDGQAWILVR